MKLPLLSRAQRQQPTATADTQEDQTPTEQAAAAQEASEQWSYTLASPLGVVVF